MISDVESFEALSRRIVASAGITADVYKDKCLRRRIGVRMRACGVHTYDDYLRLLQSSPDEPARLRDTLTINVTRFYRNRETWDLMRAAVLPARWRAGEPFTAWSAGCASGEEPYTLAMLLAELARERGDRRGLDQVRIDATDIDAASLERATMASYRAESLSETPADLAQRYLAPELNGFRVARSLRDCVRVRRFDLGADQPLRPAYDLILCRNVVIYFDRPMQERLFLTFARHLTPGGVLVLGKVETLLGPARDLLEFIDARERIYQRVS